MCRRHSTLSITAKESFVESSICIVATVGITENALDNAEPPRQAEGEL